MNISRALAALCVVVVGMLSAKLHAQAVTVYVQQGQLPRAPQNVTTLGPDLMGDAVNLYNGALQFNQTDVSLPGNSALPVAVGRRHAPGRDPVIEGVLGDWDLDVPHMRGVFIATRGWINGAGSTARCSSYTQPPTHTVNNFNFLYAEEYWQGNHLYVPGVGDQEVLRRSTANGLGPSDGNAYPLVTQKQWQIRCIPSLLNGAGEGYVARSPDGVQYQFNWMATRRHSSIYDGAYYTSRNEVWLMATHVTDRFGNWVRYSYDAANPWRLNSIQSSDGRVLNLGYTSVAGKVRLSTVSDGVRTWSYGYNADATLLSTTLPDGSRWQFNLRGFVPSQSSLIDSAATCDWPGAWPTQRYVGSITHPSGATGTFSLQYVTHGREAVSNFCVQKYSNNPQAAFPWWPKTFTNQALVEKSINGPGLSGLVWKYQYAGTWGSWSTDCQGCAATKTVTVTDPRGYATRHTFGTRFQVDEGQLLATDEGWNGSAAVRSTSYRYRAAAGQPWPEPVGISLMETSDYLAARLRPQDRRIVSQQGANFVREVSSFDAFARPRVLTRASSLGYSRTESIGYYDDGGKWVLGQVASVIEAGSGTVMEQTVFDTAFAMPASISRFGRLQQSFGYHPDGTVASVFDAAGRATRYSSYKAGIAQRIDHPDGRAQTALVNGIGLITSVTSEAGVTTGYGYDALGRLAHVAHAANDSVAWNPTVIGFAQVNADEYGLGPGHWRQTVSTGNGVSVHYFDALWRKRVSVAYDAGNAAATQRAQVWHHDADGRTTFRSHPARSVAGIGGPAAGTTTVYDALGRPVQVRVDIELGTLTSRVEYLGGFLKRAVDFKGNTTTTSYQAFDEPAEDALMAVSAPQGLSVVFQRDLFGKTHAITRSGTNAGVTTSATRSYVYDAHHRLCKTIEPEIGATVQDYDAANNVAWRSGGTALTSAVCDRGNVTATQKISFGYDARNRLLTTSFGDGSSGITRTYTADGLLETITSGNGTWTYGYNGRRQRQVERLTHAGVNRTLSWGYDANGHLAQVTYPDNVTLAYAPNALGEPTRVGGYATSVSYHPNGAVAGFSYGNGVTHVSTLNARGLPDQVRDTGVLHDQYRYDANGNVVSITDLHQGVSTRTMAYDGLDRLTAASAPQLWGNAAFSYDVLDNLRTSMRGAVHSYDARNRLNSVSGDGLNLTYAHDVNGNVSQRGSETFVFDVGNRR